MALSRFRLRLTAGFAVAFFIGTAALEGINYYDVTFNGGHEFNERLKDAAASTRSGIRRIGGRIEVDSAVFFGVREALRDWTPSRVALVIYDSTGRLIASAGDPAMAAMIPPLGRLPDVDDIDRIPLRNGLHLRLTTDTVVGTRVVAAATTDVLRRRQKNFAVRIVGASLPAALLLALTIGYLLMRFTLAPIEALGSAAERISPDALDGRLPVREPRDELDHLAARFNDLLDRVRALQQQSHRFLREVAHQLRTPLTLVVGETELALERTRDADEYTRILRRVHAAAGQMTHRVHDLLLLARMEAGERPPLRDVVELDALALEATDLFRARAKALGQHLELGDIVPCELVGDAALLREGLLELLENACRYGEPGPPVVVTVRRQAENGSVEVRNTGPEIAGERVEVPEGAEHASGLGLSIVRWIASVHGGQLAIRREGAENVVALRVPINTVAN